MNYMFSFLIIYFLFEVINSEFAYIDELEYGSTSNKNKNIQKKLSNIFSYYKDVIHDPSIKIQDNKLIEKLNSEFGKIISPKTEKLKKIYSFLQQQENESTLDEDQKVFSYQPFVLTKYYTKSDPPTERRGHTTLIVDTFLLVFGGCYQELKCYNDLFFLDLRSHKWIEIPTLGQQPSPRGGHAAILYGTTLWVFGGNSVQGYMNDLFSFNLETV